MESSKQLVEKRSQQYLPKKADAATLNPLEILKFCFNLSYVRQVNSESAIEVPKRNI